MELIVRIEKQANHEKYSSCIVEKFTEEDLLEWAKKFIEDNLCGEHEVLSVEVESITP